VSGFAQQIDLARIISGLLEKSIQLNFDSRHA
jgi:hypothetical protein